MRVLIVNRFFGEQQTPTGRMAKDVALDLHRQGHRVFVLASRSSYAGSSDGFARGDGQFDVRQVREFGVGRSLRWGSFWLRILPSLASRRWDRCLLLTDPPFLPFAAWLTRSFRCPQQRLYWWTMDIYPEALVAAGMVRESGIVCRFLRWLNELGLGQLSGVVALGTRQLQRLQTYRGWKSDPAFAQVIPPWDFRSLPKVEIAVNPVLDHLGCRGKKVALYTGNLGEGHLFTPFVEAARWLHERGLMNWHFVFVVRGSERLRLETAAAGLPNFQICDYFQESQTAQLLWSATVHLVSMKPAWEGVIVPSKLYGAFRTHAPVLFVGPLDSDTAVELEKNGRGLSRPPESTGEDVVRALESLADKAWISEMPSEASGPRRVSNFITA